MARLILVALLFLFSLLILFRAPTNLLWYVSILVTEFCWAFVLVLCVLLLWRFGGTKYHLSTTIIGIAALLIYLVPIAQALRLSARLSKDFDAVFGGESSAIKSSPFKPLQLLTGIGAKAVVHQTFTYDAANNLSLDFYPSQIAGSRPCVVVIHGGSWAGGDSHQLPELNSVLAKEGYHVASINYRLAPAHHYPAPIDDVKSAINFLCSHSSELSIDTAKLTLLGRSAGGQIALSAAYTLNDKRLVGVIGFYGPTDMVWGYQNPTNPLVLDSRRIMEDYLGGTQQQVPQQYHHSSATETAARSSPPTLLLYAENDPLVSPLHGPRLTKKLDEYGVKYFAVYLPWATHGFDYTLNGPGGQLSTWAVKRFLQVVNNQ